MKIQRKIPGLLFILLMFGCNNKQEPLFSEMVAEVPMSRQLENQEEINIERKLIKEGNVEFETEDVSSTRKIIIENVEKQKGYISSEQEYRSPGRITNTILIRVPAENFDQLLNDATKGVRKFDSKNIEVKDVTEEFLDVEARLKTKKELENRYLELLKKANSVSDIVEIEKQIGQLRSEIESIEGRLNYLNSEVSFSTLSISFYQTLSNETEFGNKFKNGFKNGWDNLFWFFVFLTNIWPFILLGIGLIFGIKMWRRKR